MAAETCIAITKAGPQCTRLVTQPGKLLCGQHQHMIDRQNRKILEAAELERARELSELGRRWRARREQIPGTWEYYLCRNLTPDCKLSFPQMCFMAQFLRKTYPGYASDLWCRTHTNSL